MKRVFIIVLDSCGIGALPDAADFGDRNCDTMRRISTSPRFDCSNLRALGLGNIDGLSYLGKVDAPRAAVAKMTERSAGKDTTIGHWEIAGLISKRPLPTFPDGFPRQIIDTFSKQTGRGILCNRPYSGTEVIRDYGRQSVQSGDLIVYTSADSVFQIAAHENVVPLETLYAYCRTARELLTGAYGVGRVIARPFVGEYPHYTRTANRRDFSLEPPDETLLDAVSAAGKQVTAVGKISDIFAGRGVSRKIVTHSNQEGMAAAEKLLAEEFEGLCFINLVDFDMLYGHRQDVDGYAAALAEFDRWLPKFTEKMRADDVLMITADHGCDPGDESTNHTREYTPLLIYGQSIRAVNLGVRPTFADIAATAAGYLDVPYAGAGENLMNRIACPEDIRLCRQAVAMMKRAYAPYSGYTVGAALLAENGKVYTGCNIENASFSPTLCAERAAFASAVSAGENRFKMIAVAGGKNGNIDGAFPPCGVCRQVMAEFCPPDFPVLAVRAADAYERYTLSDLLPHGFSPKNVEE